jgi:cobalt-zinc-cadmium efflux system outer membrane protein
MKPDRFTILFFLFFILTRSFATDSIKVNIKVADSLFQARNFTLLAAALEVDKASAQEIQAKLYPNPVLSAEWNLWDPEHKKWLHTGYTGQKILQIDQLILLGGKRKADIQRAAMEKEIAVVELEQITRQLKFELRRSLISVAQQQMLLILYEGQLAMLDSFLTSYEVQIQKGNIPLKELVRLKGAYLNLRNEKAELYNRYMENQANLQTLLQTQSIIQFDFQETDLINYVKSYSLTELQQIALEHRPEIRLIQLNQELAKQYIIYQKKLKTPDLTLYANYDQRGGAFQNQVNLGISLPIPAWNRNQGNIQAAKIMQQQAELESERIRNEILTTLSAQYNVYLRTVSEFEKANLLYNSDFDVTLKGMRDNFQKRNVTLIEFVDFFEAHMKVLAEMVRVRVQLVSTAELLNLSIGKDIY